MQSVTGGMRLSDEFPGIPGSMQKRIQPNGLCQATPRLTESVQRRKAGAQRSRVATVNMSTSECNCSGCHYKNDSSSLATSVSGAAIVDARDTPGVKIK